MIVNKHCSFGTLGASMYLVLHISVMETDQIR
jgi:hypothetical protein